MKLSTQDPAKLHNVSVVFAPQPSGNVDSNGNRRYDRFLISAIYKPHSEKTGHKIPIGKPSREKGYYIDIEQVREVILTTNHTAIKSVSKHDTHSISVTINGDITLDTRRSYKLDNHLIDAVRKAIKQST